MGKRLVRPWLGRWILSAALAIVAVLPVTPAEAHILFQDGTSGDIFQDMLLNFAVPLIVLAIGAVAGIVLARWLGRGDDAAA